MRGLLDRAVPCEDGFDVMIGPEWLQGRTAYGGLSAALALVVARQAGGEMPPLRSAQISFVGPLSGDVRVTARELRRGRNAIWVNAQLDGEKGIGLVATLVFMDLRESAADCSDLSLPENIAPPEEGRLVQSRHAPVFLPRNFEMRGARSTDDDGTFYRWLRPLNGDELDDELSLVLTADAMPPAAMGTNPPQTPISSMTWLMDVVSPPCTRNGWWLQRTSVNHAAGGLSSERIVTFNADRVPVADAMQGIAVFG